MSLIKFVRCDGPDCSRMMPLDDAQAHGWTAVVQVNGYDVNDYCPKHKEG